MCPILILVTLMFVVVGLIAALRTHSLSQLSDVLAIPASSETTPQACASVRMGYLYSAHAPIASLFSFSPPLGPLSFSLSPFKAPKHIGCG